MPARLVALDEGPDIMVLDRAMVVVGRHPGCQARLDSLRVSRHHCCMIEDSGEVVVQDLGSTNGIRINGQRVESGRLRPGDELSIAHIRYRLENGQAHEATIAEPAGAALNRSEAHERAPVAAPQQVEQNFLKGQVVPFENGGEAALAAVVRKLLPADVADKCRIQVIVKMAGDEPPSPEAQAPLVPNHAAEGAGECHSDSPL
jgi:FHA domain